MRATASGLLLYRLAAPRAYNIAMIYHGLDQREATLAWLERGCQQRELRMVF